MFSRPRLIIPLTLIWFVCLFSSRAISNKIDSLLHVIDTSKVRDSNLVNTYLALSKQFINKDDYTTAVKHAKEALNIATRLQHFKGMSRANYVIGIGYKETGDYKTALIYHLRALEIRKILKNKLLLAESYNSIGDISNNQGNYKLAFKYFILSLKMYTAINEKGGMAWAYNNMGVVTTNQNDIKGAVAYYLEAIKLGTETNDKKALPWFYNNLGNCYITLAEYNKALNCFEKALGFQLEVSSGDRSLAFTYNSIGTVHFHMEKYDKALVNFEKALELRRAITDRNGIAWSLTDIGSVYMIKKDYTKAAKLYNEALLVAEEIGQVERMRNCYEMLALSNYYLGDFKKAYDFQVKFTQIKDSMLNEELHNQLAEVKTRFETEKKDIEIKNLNRKKRLAQLEIRNKQIEIENKNYQRNGFIAGSLVLLVVLFYIFNRFKASQKQKKIIEEHKQMVEEKNMEITQSIQYAQKIQHALLPRKDVFSNIFPDSFILFIPKDIVSGDFYWVSDRTDKIFYATADCTGHGVPGGFMSMLGTALLNEIIDELKVDDCGKILNMLRDKIMQSLHQAGDSESKDGMDIVLVQIDKKTLEMKYAAANNPLYIIKKKTGELAELGCDKMPVGVYHGQVGLFNTYTHALEKGDVIITFTDGFADQFGGPKGKKFKYSSLQRLLKEYSKCTLTEIQEKLHTDFETWRGDLEQVDDVCVIGIRI